MLSRWKILKFKLRQSVKSEDLALAKEYGKEILKKSQYSLEIKNIEAPEADLANTLATAATRLHESLKNEQNVVIRLGPLIYVKSTFNNQSCVRIETISTELRRQLESNPDLMKNPQWLIKHLETRSAIADAKEPPSIPAKELKKLKPDETKLLPDNENDLGNG